MFLLNAWDGHILFLVLWDACPLFWGIWQFFLPSAALCWRVISHSCEFFSVTNVDNFFQHCVFLKQLVIALKGVWDCNHSFNNIYLLHQYKTYIPLLCSHAFLQTQWLFCLLPNHSEIFLKIFSLISSAFAALTTHIIRLKWQHCEWQWPSLFMKLRWH